MTAMQTPHPVSLLELNEFIRRMVALNFPEALWLRAEIAQVQHARGHCWLELVEKDELTDEIAAQSSAVIWHSQLEALYDKLGGELDALLQQGMAVQLKVRVDYHERYGLKLHVLDIDPAFTLGKLERARRRLIERLRAEGLLEQNKKRALPAVIQRLALISAPTAAGLQDFLTHLAENEFGYAYAYELFPAAMQGALTEPEVMRRLEEIAERKEEFDCVLLLRGGGARLDLAAFDSERLCRAIAACPLPVCAAIGHEEDQTVLDMVAHTSVRTPTAAADWLIRHNMHFEMGLQALEARTQEAARHLLEVQRERLDRVAQQLAASAHHRLQRTRLELQRLEKAAGTSARWRCRHATQQLDALARQLALLQPAHTLRRGYSLTTLPDGRLLRSVRQVQAGMPLHTHLSDGVVDSKVTHAKPEGDKSHA